MTSNTEPILQCQPGTIRQDLDLGPIKVHDFVTSHGVDHIHAVEHSVFILNSPVTVTDVWQGLRQNQVSYNAGDVIFLPGDTDVQARYVSNTYSETMVRLPGDAFAKAMGELAPGSVALDYRHFRRQDTLGLAAALRNLARMSTTKSASPLLVESLTTAAVAGLVYSLSRTSANAMERLPDGLSDRRMQRVVEYIEARLGDQITLAEIAEAAALSTFHFSRSFKQRTGLSPMRFVWERRVERAKVLLADGTLPIAGVAYTCGFSSQSHFTTAFKQVVGKTPAAFRRGLGLITSLFLAVREALPLLGTVAAA